DNLFYADGGMTKKALGGYLASAGIGAYYGAKNPKSVKKVTDPIDKAISQIGKNLTDKKFAKGGMTGFNKFFDKFKRSDAYISEPMKTAKGNYRVEVDPYDKETSKKMKDYMQSEGIGYSPKPMGKGFYTQFAKGGEVEVFSHYFDVDKVKSIENIEVFTNQRRGYKNYVRVDYIQLSKPQTMQVDFIKIPFDTEEELTYIKKTLQDNFGSTFAEGGKIKVGDYVSVDAGYGMKHTGKVNSKHHMHNDRVYVDGIGDALEIKRLTKVKPPSMADGGEVDNPFANIGKTKKQVSKYSQREKDTILDTFINKASVDELVDNGIDEETAEEQVFSGGAYDVIYQKLYNRLREKDFDELKNSFAKGGLAKGYHKMPDGTIMKDSEHYAKGGKLKGFIKVSELKEYLLKDDANKNESYKTLNGDKYVKVSSLRTYMKNDEDYAKGGAIKGRNNKTGESFGVVIGSKEFTDDDKDRIQLNVRSSYGSRISEYKLVFDKKGNLQEITDYGYSLDGYPSTSSGSGKKISAQSKSESVNALKELNFPQSFSKRVIEFVSEKSYAKGGKLRNTEYNLRTFFTFDGEDFAIFGGHLYGAREGDNEFMLIDNINYAPKEVQVAYYEKMKGFAKGGTTKDYSYDYEDIGQFSMNRDSWGNYTNKQFEKIGKDIVENDYDGNIKKAYDSIVRKTLYPKKFAKGGEVITDSFGDKYELREDEEININDYVYFGDTGDISVVEDEEDLEFARAGKTKAVPYAKGGETASPITNYHKNFMGTLSFDLKVKGMRKSQDFIVYPITGKTNIIRIQSDKKWGEIDATTGKGILSKTGNNSWAFALDVSNRNVNKFELSDEELEELKNKIRETSGKEVGNAIITTDNSGAELLADGGELNMDEVFIYQDADDNYTIVMNGDVYDMNSFSMPNTSINNYIGDRRDYPSDISHWGKKITYDNAPMVIKEKIDMRKEEFEHGGKIHNDKEDDIQLLKDMISEEKDEDIKRELKKELEKL
ncbi:hypothetical protein N8587_03195, partial [Akkermansiaceae bacterium]|nr:hypothetical protein [Akkermansiaceae bacterium]